MADVEPGEPKYEDSDRTTEESANGAGAKGDAVAFNQNGALVLTSGSNGFAGILGSLPAEAGDGVALQRHGVVPATVSPVGAVGNVSPGDRLVPAADGTLQNEDSGDGTATKAGPGELRAESSVTDGVAEVFVP